MMTGVEGKDLSSDHSAPAHRTGRFEPSSSRIEPEAFEKSSRFPIHAMGVP
jgi:hypothetical protein